MRPPINAARQARSVVSGLIRPAKIPLIPAIRPVSAISRTAESPISAPPTATEIGVKLAIAYDTSVLGAKNEYHSLTMKQIAICWRAASPQASLHVRYLQSKRLAPFRLQAHADFCQRFSQSIPRSV